MKRLLIGISRIAANDLIDDSFVIRDIFINN